MNIFPLDIYVYLIDNHNVYEFMLVNRKLTELTIEKLHKRKSTLKGHSFLDNAVLSGCLLLIKYDYRVLYKRELETYCIPYLSSEMIRYLNNRQVEVDISEGGHLCMSCNLNVDSLLLSSVK